MSDLARFQTRYVVAASGCWEWIGPLNPGGYGSTRVNGKPVGAHRAAYLLLVGPIPDGLDLDHLCRVRNCVNPDHLEPVTRSENLRRGVVGRWKRSVERCPKGHPYDAENTYQDARGWRGCRACRADASRRHKSRKVAA